MPSVHFIYALASDILMFFVFHSAKRADKTVFPMGFGDCQEEFVNSNTGNQWSKWLPAFTFVVALIILFKALDNFSEISNCLGRFFEILSPFLFGILIVYFLYIPCEKLENLYKKSKRSFVAKKARGLSVLSIYLILMLIVTLIMTFIVPILIKNLIEFARSIPDYYAHMTNNYKHILDKFTDNDILNKLDIANFTQLLDPAKLEQLGKGLMVFTTRVFKAGMGLVVSVYILLDRENIGSFFDKISRTFFEEKTQNRLKKYMRQVNKVVFAFILGKSIDSIINTVVVTSVLLIFNVKYAVLLGMICGVANFIPYLGSLIAVIFVSIITLITGGVAKSITTLVALIIFQQLDGNIIEPKIMGKTLKINPLLVIFSVIVGGAYFGVMGMFLAVPVVTVLKQILLEYIDSRNANKTMVNNQQSV